MEFPMEENLLSRGVKSHLVDIQDMNWWPVKNKHERLFSLVWTEQQAHGAAETFSLLQCV